MELSDLLAKIITLENRLSLLEQSNRLLKEQNAVLRKENTDLHKENTDLRKENAELRKELSKYKVSKNSRNSSIPPSKDDNRPKPNQSLRKPSNKPLGGQSGHKGNTLKMVEHPDVVMDLCPDYCTDCGCDLTQVSGKLYGKRQQIDLPPITPVYTEYRTYSKACNCGKVTTSNFPSYVNASVSYGPTIEGIVGYFHARHYLPYARMQEVFTDLFGVSISQGGIECLLKRFADKTTGVYEMIKQRIAQSDVVGSDETGVKVNGEKDWMWTWQNQCLTYICYSANRAKTTIDQQFPQGFPNSVLVHDGWKPQLNTKAKAHQSCFPHLLRTLKYLNQKYPDAHWAKEFEELLYNAIEIINNQTFDSPIFQNKRAQIIATLDYLLQHPPDKNHKELYTFYNRMGKERQHLFTFLYIQGVPYDNNASERAIRNIKVKQKISGQFKNQTSAQNFAKIRSVIDTVVKNGQNIISAITTIAKEESQLAY